MLKHFSINSLKWNKELALTLSYYSLSLFFIIRAIYIAVIISFTNSSLWLDEGMLAYSLSTRSIGELTSNVFEWDQSAPVLYLYLVKIITLIFGNTELTLRIWSFVAYFLTLFASYYILKKIIVAKYPLLAVAFIANMTIMLTYSYEFKPYMTDCLTVLLVIICYYLYANQRIRRATLAIIFVIFIWLSNPSAFFIGAILLYEFIQGYKNRDNEKIKGCIVVAIIVFISFVLYYIYWLKPVIDKGFMNSFWAFRRFPLIPTSLQDLDNMREILYDLIKPFRGFKFIIAPIVIAAIFINIYKIKNKYFSIFYLGILITLFASMLGKFPIHDRLCLFFYPVMVIIFHGTISYFSNKNFISNVIILALCTWAVLTTRGFQYFSDEKNIHKEYANEAIAFMEERIKEDDTAFIFYQATPVYYYQKKYQLENIDYPLIWGKAHFDDFSESDMEQVLNHAPTYLLMSSLALPWMTSTPLIDSLRTKGDLELVYEEKTTLLYYFRKNETGELE